MNEIIRTDFLVVGSGIAGLTFAMELADLGEVTVVTKKDDFQSNTNYAQGGIACVIDPSDTFESHIEDTLRTGAGLCHREAVELIVREGPEMVYKLVEWGVRFTRGEGQAEFDLGREGGHSCRRVVHAADLTGREVERALLAALRQKPSVALRQHESAYQILWVTEGGEQRAIGVRSFNEAEGRLRTYLAGAVLLATGGVGQVYLHTTNPDIATGDGVAMAFRAGIPIANMEFVQFHPTSFYSPEGRTFLISEAVRGEGAVLRKSTGETFMERYHEMGCLAPRDVVARAIDREMKMSGHSHVLLDCTHLDGDFMVKRFPNIHEDCLSRGIDFRERPIPVVPAAHYACGGVITGIKGETPMKGLFATGEVSHTGVHGANRLASNSLLEALIFSHRAAQFIRANRDKYRVNPDWPPPPPPKVRPINASFERVKISHCRDEIRRLMWDYVGIVRSTERLELAKQRLSALRREIEGYVARGYLGAELLEVWNMVEIADVIVTSALRRKESRGLHYNIDYPEPDDRYKSDTILQRKPENLVS